VENFVAYLADWAEKDRNALLCQLIRGDADPSNVSALGAMSNLEVHHERYRSHSGHDSEENLITVCVSCHEANSIRHQKSSRTF
jgi:5-methylcytosine-specific restriction endonuclease McrA